MRKLILLTGLFFLCPSSGDAARYGMSFEHIVATSAIIVEGHGVKPVPQTDFVEDKEQESSAYAQFYVTRVYKGDVTAGDIISLEKERTHFQCDTTRIQYDKEYILFLKIDNGRYVDTDFGGGQYIVEDREKGKMVYPQWGRPFYSGAAGGKETAIDGAGVSYDVFLKALHASHPQDILPAWWSSGGGI